MLKVHRIQSMKSSAQFEYMLARQQNADMKRPVMMIFNFNFLLLEEAHHPVEIQ